jgi:hypothetical protein
MLVFTIDACDMDWRRLLWGSIVWPLVMSAPIIAAGVSVAYIVEIDGWFVLGGTAGGLVLVYLGLCWILVFDEQEKARAAALRRRILGGRRRRSVVGTDAAADAEPAAPLPKAIAVSDKPKTSTEEQP